MSIVADSKIAVKVITYLEYRYPGAVFPEATSNSVVSRDVKKATRELPINAFAFRFFDISTATADGEEMMGEPKNYSPTYYPGGQVYTLEQVKNGKLGNDCKNLILDMEKNHWGQVVKTNKGIIQPFIPGDQVVPVMPRILK